jgi:hypothetical protein
MRWLVCLTLACLRPAHADVSVQERLTLKTPGTHIEGTQSCKIAGKNQRRDFQAACVGSNCSPPATDIIRLDRSVVWMAEPANRRYTELAFPERPAACAALPSAPVIDTSKCALAPAVLSIEKTQDSTMLVGHQAQRTRITSTQNCQVKASNDSCQLQYSLDVWLTREEVAGLAERQSFHGTYESRLGVAEPISADRQVRSSLLPYLAGIRLLADSAQDLKGYPLKALFRYSYRGEHCPLALPGHDSADLQDGLVARAGKSAANATADSLPPAAGWGTAGAVEHATGNGIGSYVAGSASGAFAQNLVGGLLSKAKKTVTAPAAQSSNPPPSSGGSSAITLMELNIETTAIETEPVGADAFAIPAGWKKLSPKPVEQAELSACNR